MKKQTYIRVGTCYYKLVQLPTISGDFNEILVPWSLETLRNDHGKAYVGKIRKYDGFTCIPSHLDFKQEIFGFYNTYAPLPHTPVNGPIDYSCDLSGIYLEVSWNWDWIICSFYS